MVYDIRNTGRERTNIKGRIMKKFVLLSLFATIAAVFSSIAVADVYRESVDDCDEAEMRAALDRATHNNRAVITIVECDNGVVRTTVKSKTVEYEPVPCDNCGCIDCAPREEVVNREYFVRETVQQYKPVVKYVPSGTYTRVKPACKQGC